jgi:hypothetical protein
MTDRREFSRAVKFEILRRATVDGRIQCEGCGLVLKARGFEFDHTIPEALVVDKTKPLTADDGKLLGPCCHRGADGKTKADIGQIAKAKRQERGHVLPRKRSSFQCNRNGPFKMKIGGRAERRT